MKIYRVETIGGGHGEPSKELIGYFSELTEELKEDAEKNWWSIEEIEVKKYKHGMTFDEFVVQNGYILANLIGKPLLFLKREEGKLYMMEYSVDFVKSEYRKYLNDNSEVSTQ